MLISCTVARNISNTIYANKIAIMCMRHQSYYALRVYTVYIEPDCERIHARALKKQILLHWLHITRHKEFECVYLHRIHLLLFHIWQWATIFSENIANNMYRGCDNFFLLFNFNFCLLLLILSKFHFFSLPDILK